MRQLPHLPSKSPNAEVHQQVGVTEMRITYSSPGVKGREIWGKLVPYDELWRAGANAPTKLIVSRDFTFGGKPVPSGKYSLFILPTAEKWKVVLNKDPNNHGSAEHDAKHDVAVVEVTPEAAPSRERLAYLFENTTDDATTLVLDWAGKRVGVAITVDTNKYVAENISATMKQAWRPLFNAGRHAFDQGNNDEALALFGKSIAVHATWWNHWWNAQALAKKGQHKQAREHALKARELGKDDKIFKRAFAKAVEKALASWPAG